MLIYTDFAHEIICDIARTVEEFSHLDPRAIAVAAAPRWAGSTCGHLGKCHALREREDPSFTIWVRGRRGRRVMDVSPWYRYVPAQIDLYGKPCLYLIELHLPRMLQHDPLETLVHELFHIGERFDGTLRPMRHGKMFDWKVRNLMASWERRGDPRLVEDAHASLVQLINRHGAVLGRRLPPRFRPHILEAADPPCTYEEGLRRHYPGHRLDPDFTIRPVKLSPEGTPRSVSLRDCPLRQYHPDGSTRVSARLASYLSRSTRMGVIP